MAVDVDSFTDNNIINGTLSHTVTVTPATVINSVSYRVENSTLSNEVSVDDVDYTVDDTETGVNITLKPHILRHEQASTGSADIVITITDIYGRNVNVTDSISLMELTTNFATSSAKFSNLNVATTANDLNTTDYYLTLNTSITPKGLVGGSNVNILDRFKGPVIDTNYHIIKSEFINDGEFVVTTSQPSQKVPTMIDDGALYVRTTLQSATFVAVPIARLSDFLPTSWDEASIFDNVTDTNIFKYKPNNSYLKLYTYNDGWDDRDYIVFRPTIITAQSISTQNDTYSGAYRVSTANTSGFIANVIDRSMLSGNYLTNYGDGYAIPRFAANTVKVRNNTTSQTSTLNESDYGIAYSSSSSSSSDKTLSQTVCMYATDISNILEANTTLMKDRSWLVIANNSYGTNQPAKTGSIALRVSGETQISLQ